MKIRERRAPKRLEENEDTSSGTTCPSRSQPPGLLRTKLFCELANAGSIGLLPLNAPRLFTYVGAIDVIRRIECRGHLTSGVSYRGRRQLVFFFRLPAESKYSCTMKETLVRRHCHVHAVTRMSAHNVCRSPPGLFLGAMHVCSPPHLYGRSPPIYLPTPSLPGVVSVQALPGFRDSSAAPQIRVPRAPPKARRCVASPWRPQVPHPSEALVRAGGFNTGARSRRGRPDPRGRHQSGPNRRGRGPGEFGVDRKGGDYFVGVSLSQQACPRQVFFAEAGAEEGSTRLSCGAGE